MYQNWSILFKTSRQIKSVNCKCNTREGESGKQQKQEGAAKSLVDSFKAG